MKKNRAVVIAFIFGAILTAFLMGSFLPFSSAQERPPQTFESLQPVAYASGMTGFFDRNTGMMFVYDASLDKCVFVRQLVRLGEPMKKIRD